MSITVFFASKKKAVSFVSEILENFQQGSTNTISVSITTTPPGKSEAYCVNIVTA